MWRIEGEQVGYRGSNPTFHRGYEPEVVVTDQALYLPRGYCVARRLLGRGHRIPLTEIQALYIRPATLSAAHLLAAAVTFALALLAAANAFAIAAERGLSLANAGIFVATVILLYLAVGLWRESRGRYQLIVQVRKKSRSWVTPADNYGDEKQADLKILREAAQAVSRRTGILVQDDVAQNSKASEENGKEA